MGNLRNITTKEVQQNISKLLDELPFAITRYGKVVAVATAPTDLKKKEKPTDETELEKCKQLNIQLFEQVQDLTKKLEKKEKKHTPPQSYGVCQYPLCKKKGNLKFGKVLGMWDDELGEREVLEGNFCEECLQKYKLDKVTD